jgi:hypothetical protein
MRSAHRAIFVLESPWEMDAGDANRTSVLPFVEGIAKLAGDTEVFHANFYDKSSFEKALKCLTKTRYENAIIYIAAHGSTTRIGGVKTQDLLFEVAEVSKLLNVTGVLLGSCLAGSDSLLLKVYIESSNLRWCAGYSTSVSWLEGTLMDCSLISRMLDLDEDDFEEADQIVQAIAQALAPFSRTYGVGIRQKSTRLDESMEFVVRPRGKGKRSKVVTKEVFDAWFEEQG